MITVQATCAKGEARAKCEKKTAVHKKCNNSNNLVFDLNIFKL
jgi:hypothetical protein